MVRSTAMVNGVGRYFLNRVSMARVLLITRIYEDEMVNYRPDGKGSSRLEGQVVLVFLIQFINGFKGIHGGYRRNLIRSRGL